MTTGNVAITIATTTNNKVNLNSGPILVIEIVNQSQ